MRNGGDIAALFLFLCFVATVSVYASGGHEQGDPTHPARKHNEDRLAMKRA
jgi:hypothetical protein